MASSLYESIFEKGFAVGLARGRAKGEATQCARIVVKLLARHVGAFDPAVAAHIRSVDDLDVLEGWLEEAAGATDPESPRRLVENIGKALADARVSAGTSPATPRAPAS